MFSKVRLADVIPVNNSGISSEEFSYALKAHVDFLVTNEDQIPQFCVEFDGPSHRDPVQVRRDEIKNTLLDKFDMPYVRVNARYLEDKYRGLDLLTYFVDVWFLAIAFDDAQSAGSIPWDEPFDPTFIVTERLPDGRTWPYWLSLDLQLEIQKLHAAGRIAQRSPSHWIGEDQRSNLRCLAWLFIAEDSCVFIETGMRRHRFPAVCHSEVLSQLAVYDLYDAIRAALDGSSHPKSTEDIQLRLAHYEDSYSKCYSATCSFPITKKGEQAVTPNGP